jgi:carbonic anhydrase
LYKLIAGIVDFRERMLPQYAERFRELAAFRLEHEGALDPRHKPHDQLSQINVLVQLEHLMSYPIIHEKVVAGTLQLSGWWFDVASGSMYVYDRTSRSFEIMDRQRADRLFAGITTPKGF